MVAYAAKRQTKYLRGIETRHRPQSRLCLQSHSGC
jgi:hypothetical protein